MQPNTHGKKCIFHHILSYFTKYADAYQEHIFCKALFENYIDSIRRMFFLCVTQVTKLSASFRRKTRVLCDVSLRSTLEKTCYGIYFSFNGLSQFSHFLCYNNNTLYLDYAKGTCNC